MSVSGVESLGFTPFNAPRVGDVSTVTPATSGAGATSGAEGPNRAFGAMVADSITQLEGVQDKADQMAVQAATGDSASIHGYMLAASEASVTTQVTVAARNRALEAFTEIMRLPIG